MSVTYITRSEQLVINRCTVLSSHEEADVKQGIRFQCEAKHEPKFLSYSSLKTTASLVKKGQKSFCSNCDKEQGIKKPRKPPATKPLQFGKKSALLSARNFTVVGTKADSDLENRMNYYCPYTHVHSLTYEAFNNRAGLVQRAESKGDFSTTFCSDCDRIKEQNIQFEKLALEMKEQGFGHVLVKYNATNDIDYVCGNCGAAVHSNVQALRKNTGYCNVCQNWKHRNSLADVLDVLRAHGMTLVGEYSNNKAVTVRCVCDKVFTASLCRIANGANCSECAPEKRMATATERYGEHPFASNVLQTKRKETNMRKLGVEHHMQDRETFERAQQKHPSAKEYIFPSGKKIMIRGYEPNALDLLLQTFGEDNIATGSEVPSIVYTFEGKERVYHPDIFLKSINCIVEVKSPYTLSYNLDENNAKFEAVKALGFDCRVLVFDRYVALAEDVNFLVPFNK